VAFFFLASFSPWTNDNSMVATNWCLVTFQEWVTDNPFVISPRITFEVSVRLLGGLMALGYTIATILKRNSHVFSDDRVCVKLDWLEQLNRHYVQVTLLKVYSTIFLPIYLLGPYICCNSLDCSCPFILYEYWLNMSMSLYIFCIVFQYISLFFNGN
jgi:hypothetical protein